MKFVKNSRYYSGIVYELISEYGLKHVKIFSDSSLVPSDIPIDTNDDYARNRDIKVFALVDNFKQKKK